MTTEKPAPVVLVINSGSSSLKCRLIQPDSGVSLADGVIEQIGERSSSARLDAGAATWTATIGWMTTTRR